MESKKISIENPPCPTFYVKEIITDPTQHPNMAYGDEVNCSYFTRVTLVKDPGAGSNNLEELQEQMKKTLSEEQA